MSDSLHLYLRRRQAGSAGASLGRLLVHDVEPDTTAGILSLRLEFLADADSSIAENPTYWVSLEANIRTQLTPVQEVGTVRIDAANQPPFPPTPPNMQTNVRWAWHLLPADIEVIERARLSSPSGPFYLHLFVNGVVQTRDGVFGVYGDVSFRIELSQWQRLLSAMGYTIGPTGLVALSGATLEDPSWTEASKRLAPARNHLQRGEDYAALEACLDQFEAVLTAPFNVENWKTWLAGLPEQKVDGLSRWMSGLATYLNRVGHHRDRKERNDSGDLVAMPLDHWEAELVVASTQFVLAYLLRLLR